MTIAIIVGCVDNASRLIFETTLLARDRTECVLESLMYFEALDEAHFRPFLLVDGIDLNPGRISASVR